MQHRYYAPKKKKWWVGRYILLLLVLLIAGYVIFFAWSITPPKTITIAKWNTLQKFITPLSRKERLRVKTYIATNNIDTSKLEVGSYEFSGSYSPAKYVETILAGPTATYVRYTMLEWWSIYDIDADMASKGMIAEGEFLAYVKSPETISSLQQKYPFLQQEKPLTTLEWFLYPDTYFLGTDGDPIQQLVNAALKRFDEKIYSIWNAEKDRFAGNLKPYSVSLSLPWALSLASVIQKEERNNAEKPTIAGIFLNRLSQGIQLGADISLCYGREEPYETCTPSLIARYVNDSWNIYNNRVHRWLPPTPISSVTADTFESLLDFENTPYLFYLHDSAGRIHYGKTNAEHEANKAQYLR